MSYSDTAVFFSCVPVWAGKRGYNHAQKPMQHVSLEQVIQHCQQEATQVYQQETGYCFELFRRAIEQQDASAWEALQQQYHKLVLRWVHTAAQGKLNPEVFDDLNQDAWLRFWRTLSHHTEPFSQRFPHVGAVLNYLNQCTISAFLDYERKMRRQTRLQEFPPLLETETTWDWTAYWEKKEQAERIQMIREWVVQEVSDPQEKLLLTLAYEQNLSPAVIAQQYPTHFATVADVYRVKERIMKRGKRALAARLVV